MAVPEGMLEWLGAQIDLDEAMLVDGGSCRCEDPGPQRPDCVDRVAFDVAAKRAILAEHSPLVEDVEWWDAPDSTGKAAVCTSCRPADPTDGDYDPAVEEEDFVPSYTLWPCPTVRHLATAYAGRDGWREEWRA